MSDISKLSQILLDKWLVKLRITISKNISLLVFMPNISTNDAITYMNAPNEIL